MRPELPESDRARQAWRTAIRHATSSGGAERSHRARGARGGTTLVIRFARRSPTHHRFEIVRPDGTRETHELETRSCLLHDLVHFALESEAALSNSFYGLLARGVAYAELTEGMAAAGYELALTERVVGPLQGAVKDGVGPAQFIAEFTGWQRALGETCPAWLTEDLVARVQDRLRRLQGQWRATKFGEAMELRFKVDGGSSAGAGKA